MPASYSRSGYKKRLGKVKQVRLYFIRHGESEANTQRIISNRGLQHPLTERGVEQAKALANHLKDEPLEYLYSSPLMRAVQTAEILATALGLEITTTPALREFDCGVLEGNGDAESWEALGRVWDDWMLNQKWTSQLEGGESYDTLKVRFVPLIDDIITRFGETDAQIGLVGHGGTTRAMLPALVDNIDYDFAYHNSLPNTGYVLVERRDNALTCTQWAGQRLE